MDDQLAILMKYRQLKDELIAAFRKDLKKDSNYIEAKQKYEEYAKIYKEVTGGKEPKSSFEQLYKKAIEAEENEL